MRIQHNIMALNAYRQLGGNNNALAKNLEKLSSGYRINRAGDDAAGLAISEKMRAQIKGLEAAQKNANDGISLVQTAEGALTEVHSMLNRMVYLATQSANGTYDNDVDRANLDKEVQTLKEEIDRISKSTNFNGLSLLDGSMDAATTKTTGGKTDVPILQNVATDPTKEVGTATVLHEDAPKPGKTEINVELHNVQVTSKSQVGDRISFKVGDAEVELELVDAADVDLAAGKLEAGKSYTSDEIATAIINKFNAGDKLIGGQEFTAKLGSGANTIRFEQDEIPNDKTEVVNANVGVSIDYVENPDGNPKEYTVKIADKLTTGAKIKIGGEEVELTGKLSDHFDATNPTKVGDYEVTYDAGTLKIVDPNGTLKAPTVSYDAYETALTSKPTSTVDVPESVAEVKAQGKLTALEDLAIGDKITIDGQTYELKAAGWEFDGNAADAKYTLTGAAAQKEVTIEAVAGLGADANGKTATITSATAGQGVDAANTTATAGGVTEVAAGQGYAEFDLSSLEAGDKIIVTDVDGDETEYIVGEDLDATLVAIAGGTDVTVSATGGKIKFENDNASTTTATSDAPAISIKTAKKVTKEGEVITPANADSMSGTWNVQSTKNKQGAAIGGGQLASTTFDLTTDIVADGNVLTIGDSSYVFKVGKDSTVTSQNGQTLIDLSNFEADDPDLINKAGALLANAANNAFTIGFEKDSGKISVHEIQDQKAFTNGELETVEGFDKLIYMTAPEKTETTGRGLTLQVGDTADDFQKVELNIKDMSTAGLGIADINIGTIDDATAAIAKIKDAINQVSSTRGDLGAVQNRLEHTINNLGVQAENITAAESRIRDTDMAEEMMAYTKNNILVQAAQAMLAQANQVPQGILQLLQ